MSKYWVIASVLLFSVIGVFGILLAITSPMLFDAPGSENNPYVWILLFSSLALPIVCFFSEISALIILFKSKNNKKALWVSFIPTIIIAIIIVDNVLLNVFCNGLFSC